MSLVQMPWALWRTQVLAVLRLEMKKTFFARRAAWVYFLAFAPVLIFAFHSFQQLKAGRSCNLGQDTHIFATVFQFFFLRLAVFFGCVGIFTNLFRGEVLEKSLHYYFLAPLRREVLVVGKFVSGLAAAMAIFGASAVAQFVALYCHFSSNVVEDYLFRGAGIEHLAAYLGVTLLACVGYGSVFLAAGVMFRNPLVPTVVVLAWEAMSGFLPEFLQKISVIFYLKSLSPVSVPESAALERGSLLGFLAANPTTVSPGTAIVGLLILSVAVLALSSLVVRSMQIDYIAD